MAGWFSRRVSRVARLWMVVFVLAGVLIAVVPSSALAAAPPPAPYATVVPHGYSASMTVTTGVPSQIDVWVTNSSSWTLNNCVPNFPHVTFAIGAANVTNWTFNIPSLQPGTRYYYVAVATVNGAKSCYVGQFVTLSRKVTVTFQTITVNNDSDFWGAGELTFYFKAFNAWQKDMTTNQMSINSGHTVTLNKTKSFTNVPDFLTLVVQGQDEDCNFCTYGIGPKDVNTGSTSQQDWNTASSSQISVKPQGQNESYTQTVTFSSSWWPVGFSVKAIVKVEYV